MNGYFKVKVQVKVRLLAYTSRDQQRFTMSEVAADWHELMIPQRIMQPSVVRVNKNMGRRCSM